MITKIAGPGENRGPDVATKDLDLVEGTPENPHVSCVKHVIKYDGYYPRSKRRRVENSKADGCFSLILANQVVTEDSIPAGQYKGDPLRAMRQVARLHPGECRLILEKGSWYLVPIKAGDRE